MAFLSNEVVQILQVELYAAASVAIVSFMKAGSKHQRRFDVDDKKELIETVRRQGIRIVSHLSKAHE